MFLPQEAPFCYLSETSDSRRNEIYKTSDRRAVSERLANLPSERGSSPVNPTIKSQSLPFREGFWFLKTAKRWIRTSDTLVVEPSCRRFKSGPDIKKEAASGWPLFGRDRRIRTVGILLPKQALYQAELCPVFNFAK